MTYLAAIITVMIIICTILTMLVLYLIRQSIVIKEKKGDIMKNSDEKFYNRINDAK